MARKEKKTLWLSGKFRPVRVGIYERNYKIGGSGFYPRYCLWDGEHWRMWAASVEDAAGNPMLSARQNLKWRGLASPAK